MSRYRRRQRYQQERSERKNSRGCEHDGRTQKTKGRGGFSSKREAAEVGDRSRKRNGIEEAETKLKKGETKLKKGGMSSGRIGTNSLRIYVFI